MHKRTNELLSHQKLGQSDLVSVCDKSSWKCLCSGAASWTSELMGCLLSLCADRHSG